MIDKNSCEHPTLSNLANSVGYYVYEVLALGENSRIDQVTIEKAPIYNDRIRSWFLPVMYVSKYTRQPIHTSRSLRDMNVTRQRKRKYNHHRMFYCKICATEYLEKCIRKNISLPINVYVKYF